MLLTSVRILYAFVCAGAIASFIGTIPRPARIGPLNAENEVLTFSVLFALTQLVTLGDLLIRRKRIEVLSAVYFGLLVGVLLSYLTIQALDLVLWAVPADHPASEPLTRTAVVMLTLLVLPYICISLLLQTKDDFRFIIPYVEFARELKGGRPLILDSSALIDGRIADVVETRILDSELIVPDFVLKEIQGIADSHDKMRRGRGRRGLDVLTKLQGSANADVKLHETSDKVPRETTIDQRLVALAKQLGGRVVTNDFNLNKVAHVQGVHVINLNDVANSLKPRYLPGEHIQIRVIKEGESAGQGVGYLDDGTMVVCEHAADLIGKQIDVVVTSVLQSSAGRMIFGKREEQFAGVGGVR